MGCGGAGDRKGRPYGGVAGSAGKESPSHGFAVPALFKQGGPVRTGDADDPVAVPKIFALPYGGRLKF